MIILTQFELVFHIYRHKVRKPIAASGLKEYNGGNETQEGTGMDIRQILAINTHTHINHGAQGESGTENSPAYSAKLDWLRKTELAAGVETMFCSTFASVYGAGRVFEENEYLGQLVKETDFLYQWVVIDPRDERTLEQAERMLNTDKCVGIKLHPHNHNYWWDEFGNALFSFAARHRAIVQIHATADDADQILPYADQYPDVTFIMAHLGGEAHANAIAGAKHGNVYVDTSGINSTRNAVVEYAVERVGSERILFGTDTYAAGFQRGRIDYALISDEDKANILRNNALRLFGDKLK